MNEEEQRRRIIIEGGGSGLTATGQVVIEITYMAKPGDDAAAARADKALAAAAVTWSAG